MPARLGSLAYRSGELLCYTAGVLLSGFFVVQLAQGEVERQGGISEFEQVAQSAQAATAAVEDSAAATENTFEQNAANPDTSLWAPGRVAAALALSAI